MPKKTPMRMCVGCREMKPKKELLRVVRSPGGEVSIDPGGKKSGRGAYLCPDRTCWENALSTGRLEYALHTSIKPENKEKLVEYAKGLET